MRRPAWGEISNISATFYAFADVLDGYNGTVFAYGQTGSGKTFTMMVSTLVSASEPNLTNSIIGR